MDLKEQLASLRRTLAEEEGNLLLIEEQKARYVLETEIPVTLIKEERRKRDRIAELVQRIEELARSQQQSREDLPDAPLRCAPPAHTTHIGSVTGPVHTGSGDIIYSPRDRMQAALEVSIRLHPPDCEKITYRPMPGGSVSTISTVTTTVGPGFRAGDLLSDPESYPSADAYYLRLRVQNSGGQKAETVEVFADKLLERQEGGIFREVGSFLPMNLLWSHYRQPHLHVIPPGTHRHCDLAHIIDPQKRFFFPGEQRTWPGIPPERTILSFDTHVQSNTRSHLVSPGTYRLLITVAAANAEPVTKTLEITLTGDWYDEQDEMLGRGIIVRVL